MTYTKDYYYVMAEVFLNGEYLEKRISSEFETLRECQDELNKIMSVAYGKYNGIMEKAWIERRSFDKIRPLDDFERKKL